MAKPIQYCKVKKKGKKIKAFKLQIQDKMPQLFGSNEYFFLIEV